MQPILTKVNLAQLPLSQRKRICECDLTCDKGISLTTYNDGFIMCWSQARSTFYDLMKHLEERTNTEWANGEVDFIIAHIKENGTYYGMNRVLAEQLGKTLQQVKSKLYLLRKQGKI